MEMKYKTGGNASVCLSFRVQQRNDGDAKIEIKIIISVTTRIFLFLSRVSVSFFMFDHFCGNE